MEFICCSYSFGMFECVKRVCSFAKVDIPLPATLSRHGERRRVQCGSENANCWCSQELEEVWGHIQTAFWIWYGIWSRNVKDQGKTDFSPRNVWIKIVWEINFNPSWKSTLHFSLLKIKSALQRTLREEGFTSCRPRKAHLLQDLQAIQIKARPSFVNRQLDKDVKFWSSVPWWDKTKL